ncbi:calcium-binding protein [Roseovarius aestuariivivens]|uniref:calcium-binding protein n=1 Tax=Roseovarius aestuariivivens TaxID=1888910 RepID=UPI00108002E1|nr:calcium-binding protein [Roseovarius aestuariivivens]
MSYIYGTNGDNWLFGTSQNNQINGFGGHDRLYGGYGNDTLSGGAGNDSLNGGSGYDTFYASTGQDEYYGGAGNDAFMFSFGFDAPARIDGGTGRDTLDYSWASEGQFIYLDAPHVFLVEDARGSSFDDHMIGTQQLANRLEGEGGNDTIFGLAEDDTLLGGAGNDQRFQHARGRPDPHFDHLARLRHA